MQEGAGAGAGAEHKGAGTEHKGEGPLEHLAVSRKSNHHNNSTSLSTRSS